MALKDDKMKQIAYFNVSHGMFIDTLALLYLTIQDDKKFPVSDIRKKYQTMEEIPPLFDDDEYPMPTWC